MSTCPYCGLDDRTSIIEDAFFGNAKHHCARCSKDFGKPGVGKTVGKAALGVLTIAGAIGSVFLGGDGGDA